MKIFEYPNLIIGVIQNDDKPDIINDFNSRTKPVIFCMKFENTKLEYISNWFREAKVLNTSRFNPVLVCFGDTSNLDAEETYKIVTTIIDVGGIFYESVFDEDLFIKDISVIL